MVRDEADIIAYTLRHLLEEEGVDHLIVADNLSTDDTRSILEGFPRSQVTILDDLEEGYDQSTKMSRPEAVRQLLASALEGKNSS